jgi:hypothetical protein
MQSGTDHSFEQIGSLTTVGSAFSLSGFGFYLSID